MTPDLITWAARWNVSPQALTELANAIAPEYFDRVPVNHVGEAFAQGQLRIAAGQDGWPLWRNNNIAAETKGGRQVRAGLGNDSKRVSDAIKSSDLIGCKPLVITPQHVGTMQGIFVAVEVKPPEWTHPTNDRERAQEKFISLVLSLGGRAGFATHESHLRSIAHD